MKFNRLPGGQAGDGRPDSHCLDIRLPMSKVHLSVTPVGGLLSTPVGQQPAGGFFWASAMKKVTLLIDGGYLRPLARQAGKHYDPNYIEKVAHACVASPDEELFRAMYYDCAPFVGTKNLPVSNQPRSFTGSDRWLRELGQRDLFAIREGTLAFRGWKPKALPVGKVPTDDDFEPSFEQKGVDMRIGLDIATISHTRAVERILLLTGDTDFIPAMKYARTAGLQIVSILLPNDRLSMAFLEHVDIKRPIQWP